MQDPMKLASDDLAGDQVVAQISSNSAFADGHVVRPDAGGKLIAPGRFPPRRP